MTQQAPEPVMTLKPEDWAKAENCEWALQLFIKHYWFVEHAKPSESALFRAGARWERERRPSPPPVATEERIAEMIRNEQENAEHYGVPFGDQHASAAAQRIASLAPQATVPEGWPTPEMVAAGKKAFRETKDAGADTQKIIAAFKAMFAASPSPPGAGATGVEEIELQAARYIAAQAYPATGWEFLSNIQRRNCRLNARQILALSLPKGDAAVREGAK